MPTPFNNGVAVGPDNKPVFNFSFRAYQGQSNYQVRKLSNDLTTNTAIWARNIGGTYFVPAGIVIDKDTTTSVLFGTTGGTLDNTGSGASTINLATGMNFYLARINSKGQWSSNTNIGVSGVNYTPEGIFLYGGICTDSITKEIRVGVNLSYQNFKAGYQSLNPKAPLIYNKLDAFVLKYGCVKVGFYNQPKDSLACPNGTIYAAVEALGSNFIYSWKKNNVSIGTNSPFYSKTEAAFADSGYYKVDISSVCFKDTTYAKSDSVKLGVKLAPVILTQPKGDTLCIGKYAKLGVKAKGYGITYLWSYTGCSNCVMSTTDSMSTIINSKYNVSSYFVTVKDVCNRTITSDYAPIIAETAITDYSTTSEGNTCLEGAIRLTSTATTIGYPNTTVTYVPKLKYTWKLNNVVIPNYNLSYIEKSNATYSDSGNYSLEISNTGCKTPVKTPAVKVVIATPVTSFNSGNSLNVYFPFNNDFKDESTVRNYSATSTATFTVDKNAIPNSSANFATAAIANSVKLPDSTFTKSAIGTLSFWIKTSVANQVVWGMQNKALTASPNVTVINGYIDYNGYYRGGMYTGSAFTTTVTNKTVSKVIVNDNKWHNITITYKTNTQSTYIDGQLQYTIASPLATFATKSFVDYPLIHLNLEQQRPLDKMYI